MSTSFLSFGNFTAIISLKMLSVLFLFSSSGITIWHMLVAWWHPICPVNIFSLFFILLFFLLFYMVVSNPAFEITDYFSSARSCVLLKSSLLNSPVIVLFSSKISIWFFYIFCLVLTFSVCICIFFLILFSCLFVFSCSSLRLRLQFWFFAI